MHLLRDPALGLLHSMRNSLVVNAVVNDFLHSAHQMKGRALRQREPGLPAAPPESRVAAGSALLLQPLAQWAALAHEPASTVGPAGRTARGLPAFAHSDPAGATGSAVGPSTPTGGIAGRWTAAVGQGAGPAAAPRTNVEMRRVAYFAVRQASAIRWSYS
jgi:hypothetical protein